MYFWKKILNKNDNYSKKHLFLFVIDGFKNKSVDFFINKIDKFQDNTLKIVINKKARTILPSCPESNLVSLLTGTPLEYHGKRNYNKKKNSFEEVDNILFQSKKLSFVPTIFWYLKNKKNFFIYENAKVLNLFSKEEDFKHFNLKKNKFKDIITKINNTKPTLTIFHFSKLFKQLKNNNFQEITYQTLLEKIIEKINFLLKEIYFLEESFFIITSTCGIKKNLNISQKKIFQGLSFDETEIPQLFLANDLKNNTIKNEIYDQTNILPTISTILNFDILEICNRKSIKFT